MTAKFINVSSGPCNLHAKSVCTKRMWLIRNQLIFIGVLCMHEPVVVECHVCPCCVSLTCDMCAYKLRVLANLNLTF